MTNQQHRSSNSHLKGVDKCYDADDRSCTVLALHNITGIPYKDCYNFMKHFGRVHGRGLTQEVLDQDILIQKNFTKFRLKKGPYTRQNRITISQFC